MRKYRNAFGEDVDLDSDKTYNGLPKTIQKLNDLMLQKIGYTYCYMNHWHKKDYKKGTSHQRKSIEFLIKNFAEGRKMRWMNKDVMWFKEQVYLFWDEIENMC